jgi:hypothetical protein
MVDKYSLRHMMAAVIVAEELRVPSIRSGDPHFVDDLIRKQFSPMVTNTYIIVDLMFEIGDLRQDSKDNPDTQDLYTPPTPPAPSDPFIR